MWWVTLGLYVLSAALAPPCSYVRVTDGDTFSLIVVDGALPATSKYHAVQAAMNQRKGVSKQTTPFKADSTLRTSWAAPHQGNYYRAPVPVNFRGPKRSGAFDTACPSAKITPSQTKPL